VLAFSWILNNREVLILANTHTGQDWIGEVAIDRDLNPAGAGYQIDLLVSGLPEREDANDSGRQGIAWSWSSTVGWAWPFGSAESPRRSIT